ncbi:hypothetical protein C8R47DRAFT_1121568 [Mycena vitilis]|nr:hypothetical protein C8R47DRAFT_1121568 [Mycena vitilis]
MLTFASLCLVSFAFAHQKQVRCVHCLARHNSVHCKPNDSASAPDCPTCSARGNDAYTNHRTQCSSRLGLSISSSSDPTTRDIRPSTTPAHWREPPYLASESTSLGQYQPRPSFKGNLRRHSDRQQRLPSP